MTFNTTNTITHDQLDANFYLFLMIYIPIILVLGYYKIKEYYFICKHDTSDISLSEQFLYDSQLEDIN